MQEKKIHSVYIDTKIDKNQNPNKFKVKLNNGFLRNKILNSDNSKTEWYLSLKSLALFNSFSNITKNIDDKIILYVAKDDTKPSLVKGNNDADYDFIEIILPEGNPNVLDIQKKMKAFLLPYGLDCNYESYDSTFVFSNLPVSTDKRIKVFEFYNTYDLLGFNENELYELNNNTTKSFKSNRNVNMMQDRLLKFSIGNNSDFCIKNMNYCNHLQGIFSQCNIFHLQAVNVNPYDLIYYQRSDSNDMIPIELYKNNIEEFTIIVQNNDNQDLEGLVDYILVLDFVQIKTIEYDYKIYKLLKDIYLWVGTYLCRRI